MCTVQEDADGAGGSLLSEVREPTGGAAGCDEIEGPDAVLQAAEEWVPTPVELDNARLHDSSSFDIITTLVDIYGDSLFVAEYKCALVAAPVAKRRSLLFGLLVTSFPSFDKQSGQISGVCAHVCSMLAPVMLAW